MPKNTKSKQLVVEGKNDQHVVWHLCEKNNIQETFEVLTPSNGTSEEADGIDLLINQLPVRVKQPGLKTCATSLIMTLFSVKIG